MSWGSGADRLGPDLSARKLMLKPGNHGILIRWCKDSGPNGGTSVVC